MALFRRNKSANTTAVPEEVTSYYQAEKRDRTWMAWLLALLSLAVTALVVMALFFGGRWVYRKVKPNTAPGTPISGDKSKQSPVASNNPTQPSTDKSSTSTDPNKDKPTVNAPTNPTPSTSTSPGASNTTPATTANPNSNLPNTGPGDVLAIFMITSVAGAIVYRYVLRPSAQ